MPWFLYGYPLDAHSPSSYSLIVGVPSCAGIRLCAIYAPVEPNTDPPQPIISPLINSAINNAQNGIITPGVTKLRPNYD